MTLELGWFSTAKGQGSLGMFERVLHGIESGEVDANIQFVFCNREEGEGEGSDNFFDLVRSHNIPLLTCSSRKFRAKYGNFETNRYEFDTQIQNLIGEYNTDLNILAGYLLILGFNLCTSHTFLNLHPALPGGPKGLWDDVIRKLIAQRAQETGSMMALVTEKVDEGPPLAFTRFSLNGPEFDGLWAQSSNDQSGPSDRNITSQNPLFQLIRKEGLRREPALLIETLKAFNNGNLQLPQVGLLSNQEWLNKPYDLTSQVELSLS